MPGVQATDEDVDNVLVIWCAKLEGRGTVVVVWYKNATVYRYYGRRIYVVGKKKRQKQKSGKADDYYNDGSIELARHGKVVSMRNLSTPEQHARIRAFHK